MYVQQDSCSMSIFGVTDPFLLHGSEGSHSGSHCPESMFIVRKQVVNLHQLGDLITHKLPRIFKAVTRKHKNKFILNELEI